MVAVLFVCTGNAARSQMAEGLLKTTKSELTVLSAGTKPEGLSPQAVKAMKKIGIDISDQTSKHIDDVSWDGADYAITLCGSANEVCADMNWPETCIREHWPIKDPISDDDYINARDEINKRIEKFVNSLN